jgi:hypothetical protein
MGQYRDIKGSKQDEQNWIRSPMHEEGKPWI